MKKEVDIADDHKVACPTKEQRGRGQDANAVPPQFL